MSLKKISYKICSLIIAIVLVFQSLHEINPHSYSTGLPSYHAYCPKGISCCFGPMVQHMARECGKTFHLYN